MSDSFKAMSAEALDASIRQLSELAKTQLQISHAQATGELEKRKQAVEQMVKPLQQQLEILNRERVETGARSSRRCGCCQRRRRSCGPRPVPW